MEPEFDWIQALDRMSSIIYRVFLAYKRKVRAEDPAAKQALIDQYQREMHFYVRRNADPEFSRFINRKLDFSAKRSKKKGIGVERNMKLLSEAILVDIAALIQKKWATANMVYPHLVSVVPGSQVSETGESFFGITYDRYHRLLEQFPEVIYTKQELESFFKGKSVAGGRRREDRRERVIGTPFSYPVSHPVDAWIKAMIAGLGNQAKGENLRGFLTQVVKQMAWTDRIDITDTIDLRMRILFQSYLEGLLRKFGLVPANLPQNLVEKWEGIVAAQLYTQTRLSAELHWFRMLSIKRQKQLIFRQPTALKSLTKREVLQNLTVLREYLKADHAVLFAIITSLESLLNAGMSFEARELFLGCVDRLNLSEDDRANCLHHLAMVYIFEKKVDLARDALERAASVWEKLGGHPGDQSVEVAYLAEISRESGDVVQYESLKAKAELLANSEELTTTRKCYIAYWIVECANAYRDTVWGLKVLEHGQRVAIKDKNSLNFFEFFEQCTMDVKHYGEWCPDDWPGRVPRPPMFKTLEMSGILYLTLDDPDFGN